MFLFPGGDNGPIYLLRSGSRSGSGGPDDGAQLVRAPDEHHEYDEYNEYYDAEDGVDGYDDEEELQLYHRRRSARPPTSPTHPESPEEAAEIPEEAEQEHFVRQMITAHEEERIEMTVEDLIQLHNQGHGRGWEAHPYPLIVPGVCFRLPPDGPVPVRQPPPPPPSSSSYHYQGHGHDRDRELLPLDPLDLLDVMTIQRNRLLPSRGYEMAELTGMVLGIAIHEAVMDAEHVDLVMARLRTELLREVLGWELQGEPEE